MTECIFCKIVTKELPATLVHDDEHTLAFMDITQVNPGHVLIALKAHSENIYELNEAQAAAVFGPATRLAKAIRDAFSPHGLSVYQANGTAAGQQVFHFHVHLIPRYNGDDVSLVFPRKNPTREQLEAYGANIRARLTGF
jgi:histidine triad (HIT) family protein